MEEMSLADFRKMVETGDSRTTVWNKDLFRITCAKCGSENIYCHRDFEYHEGGGGCESCGYGGEGSAMAWCCVKCLDCGNAMVLLDKNE